MTRSPDLVGREFAILSGRGLPPGGITTRYQPGPGLSRPTAVVEYIECAWRRRRTDASANAVPLFNGSLFRLARFHVAESGLCLELGDTDYREFVGTRDPEFRVRFPVEPLSDPLAVCAAIVTSDNRIVLGRRTAVETHAGRYHVVGGFMDRGRDLGSGGGAPDPVLALVREIREETGLEVAPARVRLLGLVYDWATPHPELCFSASAGVAADAVSSLFCQRPAEREAERLEFIDANEQAVFDFLVKKRRETTPTGAACLALYGCAVFGASWFERVMGSLLPLRRPIQLNGVGAES